jgi:hypothetical protein
MTTWQQTIYTIVLVAVISRCLSVVVSYGPGTLQAFRAASVAVMTALTYVYTVWNDVIDYENKSTTHR